MELDKRGAEREEKAAVAIASNQSFSGWTKTVTDPRLCAAIADRLTFGGNIIETARPHTVSRTPAASAPPSPADCPGAAPVAAIQSHLYCSADADC